jgi:hypothetical protein
MKFYVLPYRKDHRYWAEDASAVFDTEAEAEGYRMNCSGVLVIRAAQFVINGLVKS